MIFVAIVIAVDQVRSDFPQVACFDRSFAHHAEGLSAGHPAVHQHESHAVPPDANNAVSAGSRPLGGEAYPRIRRSGLAGARSIFLAGVVDIVSPAIGSSDLQRD